MLIVTGVVKLETEEELARVKQTLIKRARKSRQDGGRIAYTFSINPE